MPHLDRGRSRAQPADAGQRQAPTIATRSPYPEAVHGLYRSVLSRHHPKVGSRGRVSEHEATTPIDGHPLEDVRDEADRVANGAVAAGLQLRLIGGMAVYLTSPSVRRPPFARDYGDFDFAVSAHDARPAAAFLESAGYVPEKMFNALHGAQRLNFRHPEGRWPIDVVVDEVRMSHRIDLRGRINGPGPTVHLADLLLTKLQIWEINSKDLGDIVCLVADHELADQEGAELIDRRRITALARSDWGLCHTLERNLRRAAEEAGRRAPIGAPFEPIEQANALLAAIAEAPKSLGWQARARVGERVRWYETPEEVRH
jgi:hypothetical protein